MEKSKIWHDRNEVPAIQYVNIYLLDENRNISLVFYCKTETPWNSMYTYCEGEFVAWAYTSDIVNL